MLASAVLGELQISRNLEPAISSLPLWVPSQETKGLGKGRASCVARPGSDSVFQVPRYHRSHLGLPTVT